MSADIIAYILPLLKKGFSAVVDWLLRLGPAGLRYLALGSLCVLVVSSSMWVTTNSSIQSAAFDTLSADLEKTSETHKGVEAFVLSVVSNSIDKTLGQAVLTPDFNSALRRIQQDRLVPTDGSRYLTVYRPHRLSADGATARSGAYVTARADAKSFMFFPGQLLRGPRSDDEIKAAVVQDKQLMRECSITRLVADQLASLSDSPIFSFPETSADAVDSSADDAIPISNKSIQSYVITGSGMIRILQPGGSDQASYYRDQFDASTFFPGRPYYRETMDDPTIKSSAIQATTVAERFHRTKPYVDLGGNGIVTTLSMPLGRKDLADAILCFDFDVNKTAGPLLERRIRALGGECSYLNCSIPSRALKFEKADHDSATIQEISQIEHDYWNSTDRQQSRILGGVFVLRRRQPTRIDFTVPLGQADSTLRGKAAPRMLLYCHLDLGSLQHKGLYLGMTCGGSFALLVISVLFLIADYGLRLREQQKAFSAVALVMERAPMAYCQLGDEDRIQQFNRAFLELIGLSNDFASRKQILGREFRDFLADDSSREIYDAQQAERREHPDRIREYIVLLRRGDGSQEQSVRITAADVPEPVTSQKEIPHSFGVLVPVKDNRQTVSEFDEIQET